MPNRGQSSTVVALVALGAMYGAWGAGLAWLAWLGGLLILGAFLGFALWVLWPQMLAGVLAVAAVWWVFPQVQRVAAPTETETVAWVAGLVLLHLLLLTLRGIGAWAGARR